MNKDYIYYLAFFSFVIGAVSMFLDDFVSKREQRIISFLLITLPIYGRLFGWW